MVKKYLLIITLALCIQTLYAQEQDFQRKIELTTFVPKGQWIMGSTVSFSEYNQKNYQFLIIDGLNSDGYTFKVTPMLFYAFKDNLAAGAKFSYKRTLMKIDGVTINVDEENQFDVNDLYQLKRSEERRVGTEC